MIPLFALALACGGEEQLLVFTAASAAPAMEEAVASWGEARISSGASSVLVRQAEAGARPDVLLLASTQWADRLEALERVDLLSNELVVLGSLDEGCIAVGDPDHVPAGQYAKQALQDRWSALEDRIVPAMDGPAAVALVASGACPAAIAYATDVRRSGLPAGEPLSVQPDIRYPLLLGSERGRGLYEHLQGEIDVFERHGFVRP